MGLNIGIRIKRQREEYMSYGCNPKGTPEEITSCLREMLTQKFPRAIGTYGVDVYVGKEEYDFDVRFVKYADGFGKAGYEVHDMYLALLDFALQEFNADYGIDIHVYHSP